MLHIALRYNFDNFFVSLIANKIEFNLLYNNVFVINIDKREIITAP